RAFEGQGPFQPVEAVEPLLAALVVEAGQGPLPATERQPPGIDPPALTPGAEADTPAFGDGPDRGRHRLSPGDGRQADAGRVLATRVLATRAGPAGIRGGGT